MYTVCIMITDPTDGHTEITSNGAGLVYNNCMNQVNTNNWDAVQADDNSYITGTNSDNCFVGNIHFGNLTPAKDPSCTLFPDPFASYTMPASAKSCDYGNPPAGSTKSAANKAMPAPTTTTYSPGTYCGNVNISPANGSNVTMNPGVYIINAGTLTMKNNINVTATGVTILLTGNNAGLNFQNVNLNMTPSTSAGDFSNFLFFLDQSGCTTQKGALQCPFQSQSQWTNVTMNSNGIIYLVNQEFDVNGCTKSCTGGSQNITLNPGSVIAGSLVPSGNVVFSVTGYPTYSAGAPGQLQKTSNSASNPRLIR
jgi:hypothetical protein